MTVDALADPDRDGTFPFCPRDDEGYLDETLMPVEPYLQGGVLIDPCPSVRGPDGALHPITDYVPRRPR